MKNAAFKTSFHFAKPTISQHTRHD